MTRALALPRLEPADWWAVRRAQSLKPATYRCPLCGYRLHAMSPHVLIAPEGDTLTASPRARGVRRGRALTTYAEWRKPAAWPGLVARLLAAGERGYTVPSRAPVAQGIERCPAEAEVACSNHAGRISSGRLLAAVSSGT